MSGRSVRGLPSRWRDVGGIAAWWAGSGGEERGVLSGSKCSERYFGFEAKSLEWNMGVYASNEDEGGGMKERVSRRHAWAWSVSGAFMSVDEGSYIFRLVHHWRQDVFGTTDGLVKGTTMQFCRLHCGGSHGGKTSREAVISSTTQAGLKFSRGSRGESW